MPAGAMVASMRLLIDPTAQVLCGTASLTTFARPSSSSLDHEDLTAREPAVKYTDEKRYFVSESSAYRILKAEDLITAPAHVVI